MEIKLYFLQKVYQMREIISLLFENSMSHELSTIQITYLKIVTKSDFTIPNYVNAENYEMFWKLCQVIIKF